MMNQEPILNIPIPVLLEKDARQNLRWLFVLRNLMILGETLVIWISLYGLEIPLRETPLWGIITAMGLFNWWTWLRLGHDGPIDEQELFIQISFDVLAITGILYFTGGATNPIAWFFLLPLIIAATILPQFYIWYMVIFTTGCYTLLMAFYEPLPSIQPMAMLHHDVDPALLHALSQQHGLELHVFGMWFGFVFSAVLVAYFVVEMANTLRSQERRLAQAREQALRNERVLALGTLAAGAAHEMGTPLGTMAILIKEIENECGADTPVDLLARLKILRTQVDRCKKALSVMSASAGEQRAESGHVMSLPAFLDETVESWKQQRHNPVIDYHKRGVILPSSILAEQTLNHALVNILNNAADASPEGVEMIANWTQDTVTIDILDNGPGITPGLHAKLGKTPVTTKEQGLGLGLFLAFTTVERLGGLVEMKPRISGGTCTTIQLPLLKHHA